jgi:uncharacterized protein HemX
VDNQDNQPIESSPPEVKRKRHTRHASRVIYQVGLGVILAGFAYYSIQMNQKIHDLSSEVQQLQPTINQLKQSLFETNQAKENLTTDMARLSDAVSKIQSMSVLTKAPTLEPQVVQKDTQAISNHVAQLEQLKPLIQVLRVKSLLMTQKKDSKPMGWRAGMEQLKQFVVIQYHPDPSPSAPVSVELVRQTLQFDVILAQWALINEDTVTYQRVLSQMKEEMALYFDLSSTTGIEVLRLLK